MIRWYKNICRRRHFIRSLKRKIDLQTAHVAAIEIELARIDDIREACYRIMWTKWLSRSNDLIEFQNQLGDKGTWYILTGTNWKLRKLLRLMPLIWLVLLMLMGLLGLSLLRQLSNT